MSTTDLDTYAGQIARLKTDYIKRAGREVALALDVGPCSLPYAPGNGTLYELVFVPVPALQQLGALIPDGTLVRVPEGVGRDDEGWVVVSKVDGSRWAGAFDLRPGTPHFVHYVADHLATERVGIADASALVALFRAITGVAVV